MAVTAAVTPIRIVGADTLGAALRRSEHGANAQRTFRFRHTGNLQTKFAEARQVLGMTIDYQEHFTALADRLALVGHIRASVRGQLPRPPDRTLVRPWIGQGLPGADDVAPRLIDRKYRATVAQAKDQAARIPCGYHWQSEVSREEVGSVPSTHSPPPDWGECEEAAFRGIALTYMCCRMPATESDSLVKQEPSTTNSPSIGSHTDQPRLIGASGTGHHGPERVTTHSGRDFQR